VTYDRRTEKRTAIVLKMLYIIAVAREKHKMIRSPAKNYETSAQKVSLFVSRLQPHVTSSPNFN